MHIIHHGSGSRVRNDAPQNSQTTTVSTFFDGSPARSCHFANAQHFPGLRCPRAQHIPQTATHQRAVLLPKNFSVTTAPQHFFRLHYRGSPGIRWFCRQPPSVFLLGCQHLSLLAKNIPCYPLSLLCGYFSITPRLTSSLPSEALCFFRTHHVPGRGANVRCASESATQPPIIHVQHSWSVYVCRQRRLCCCDHVQSATSGNHRYC